MCKKTVKWSLILETDDRKVYFQLDSDDRYTGVTKVEHKVEHGRVEK